MAEPQHVWPVSGLCDVLGVRRRGFDAYLPRHAKSAIAAPPGALVARVQAIAAQTRHSSGSRRMAKQLQAEGLPVGRAKARRLMQEAGVAVPRPKRRGPVTTDSHHSYGVAPNLLARQFDVAAPAPVWAGDITSIWTAEGGLYWAVLLDLYARKVVGWAMRSQIDTPLVQDALPMALGRRHPVAGLLHHADRGSPYASHAYQDVLSACGIRASMSEKGECLDNAVAERFFGSLQPEWTSHCHYGTRQEARDDSVAYIEMFYNSKRQHSYLGYVSPNE